MMPSSLAADAAGNLYIGDMRGFIAQVTPDGMLTVVAGNGKWLVTPTPGPALESPVTPVGLAVCGVQCG